MAGTPHAGAAHKSRRDLLSTIAFMSCLGVCHLLTLTATAATRLERQLTWLPHGEHAQPLLQHLRRPLLLAGQSGTTFGFASGAGTKDTAESDSQDGKAAPAFSFGGAGTSFPSVASVLGTSNGEGLQQMTQTLRPSHVACSLAIVSPKREHIRSLGHQHRATWPKHTCVWCNLLAAAGCTKAQNSGSYGS